MMIHPAKSVRKNGGHQLSNAASLMAICISAVFCQTAHAQTATPSVLPPVTPAISSVDRSGVDRTNGVIADVNTQAVSIGNQASGLKGAYDSTGSFDLNAYIQLEKVSIYSGGAMVARVSARGSVHIFPLGSITQTSYYAPANHVAWTFGPLGTSTSNATSDTFNDYNDDGAILVCSGVAANMYRGGTCSLYWAKDGSRTDFKMPSVLYDYNIRSWNAINTAGQVAYMWPTQTVLSDGEVLTYRYNNYNEYTESTGGTVPPPTKWNALDSSLGFRIYLSGGTPTGSQNPGAFYPAPSGGSADLYAINLAREYADPATLSRSFGAGSQSSARSAITNGWTLLNNGVAVGSTTATGNTILVTKPNGGTTTYTGPGVYLAQIYNTGHGLNGGASTPSGAFPYPSFTATRNSATAYAISIDNSTNYVPEKYSGTVTNPDGSTETFWVRYGLMYGTTDGLGRSVSYSWSGAEGYFSGIPGYARLARLLAVTAPDGSATTYSYLHGGISGSTVTPAGGGTALTTTVGLASSCTTANYRVCNKPNYIIDPKGNQTDFTYDPAHGGILTETSPPDANGVRPQKRYTYSLLYPKVLNASNVLVNSTPVWRVTQMSECTSAVPGNPASCVGTAAERVTTFSYNDNNLFLTSTTVAAGDGSASATTSSTYDYAGNVTSVDGPRTDVDDRAYTTYDALRRKVFEIGVDPDGAGSLPRQIVKHVYDADGNEIRTEIGTGNATDGSDFSILNFKRMTYDAVTGQLVKTEEVAP